ncbi:conserved protein of unknown function [Candidatus Filomicrobium marinum]|uniref:Nucleoside 2-deoxyribosyltransferase n=1 Tax=Candidatus Filomicrobium marinum TaxID=1608628 RepID=A0A0D6JFA7_9HYPH|nr:nucleoside 2-deoxyribosyltransferase [Candidatus Filomicrobium marinum]CFX23841.1 conserved protein of unknown function [Candidatus Filomicrobium marinum]CPR19097.1 conserved protein of unknown function [Candidatus Filomicrobium marinum]
MKRLSRTKAYLASPLFNPQEREFNLKLSRRLEAYLDVFLPQRDGELLTELVSKGRSVTVCQELIYAKDTAAIEGCDFLIAVLDGRTVDEGVAFELGYARALGKICLGFKSDDRVMVSTGDNPLLVSACHYRASSVDVLIDQVRCLLDQETIIPKDTGEGIDTDALTP